MPSSAFWAYGSALQLGDGATPEVFTSIAEITELEIFNLSRDSIDVTSHDSADGYKEKIPGMRDAGSLSIKANWLPTNATHDATTGLLSTFNDDLNHNWKIVLPDTLATVSMRGHVNEFKADGPIDEQGQLEFSIELTGKPTIT